MYVGSHLFWLVFTHVHVVPIIGFYMYSTCHVQLFKICVLVQHSHVHVVSIMSTLQHSVQLTACS